MKEIAVDAARALESKETNMKKLLALFLVSMACVAQADAHGYYRGGCCYRGGYGSGWIAPALIGGAIGYGLSRPYYDPMYVPPPVIYTQPPVYVQQQPVIVQQPGAVPYQANCVKYVIQNEQGQTVREETRCN